jgi:hypothetical protein
MESILNTATKKVEQSAEQSAEQSVEKIETIEDKKVVGQSETREEQQEEQPEEQPDEQPDEKPEEQLLEKQSETREEQLEKEQKQESSEKDSDSTIKNININVSKKDKKSFDNIKYVPNKDSSGNITYKEVIIEKKDSNDDINKTPLSKLTPKSVTDNILTNQNEFKDNETEETNILDVDVNDDAVEDDVIGDVIEDNEYVNDEEDFETVSDDEQYQDGDIYSDDEVDDNSDNDYDLIEESGEYDDKKYLDDIINLRDTRQSSLNTNTSSQKDPTRHMVRKKVLKLRKNKQPQVDFF